MCNDFELYYVHAQNAETEKWFIFNTKIDYVEYNRKELPFNRVTFSPTEVKCLKGYRQLQCENGKCHKINFDSMTQQF